MNAELRRLSILSAEEVDDLYALPRFTNADRRLYYDLSAAEREAAGAIRTASVAVHLILQLGYFKAKRQFFLYEMGEVREDIAHLLERYFPGRRIDSIKMPSKPTRLEQYRIILNLFGYRSCNAAAKEGYKELRREVARRKFFQPLHAFAQQFLENAGLSSESGKYYASLVKFYTVYKLQRMPSATARLYLLCFAYHRFRQINDNLIEAFIHLIDQYESQARAASEAAMQQSFLDATENLKAAGQVLTLFTDASIAEEWGYGRWPRYPA